MAPERRIGIVVEGIYDRAVFEVLIPRSCPGIEVVALIAGGCKLPPRKVPGLLKALEYQAWPRVAKALVIRDSNGRDAAVVEREMMDLLGGHAFAISEGVAFHAVRRETETWLLADSDAISAAAAGTSGRRAPPVSVDLEEIEDPKGRLQRMLREVDLLYAPGTCADIARRLDLDRLRARWPNFREFERKLLPP